MVAKRPSEARERGTEVHYKEEFFDKNCNAQERKVKGTKETYSERNKKESIL